MTVIEKEKDSILEVVHAAIDHYGPSQKEVIPILTEVNRKLGYLPQEALIEISSLLKEPRSNLLSVASFYHMLSTKPRGRHVIQFCESAPCHVVGGREVWDRLKEELQLEPEQTSPDGKWTLITTSCLGVCGVGPVFIIDDDIYGNVTPKKVPEILAKYA